MQKYPTKTLAEKFNRAIKKTPNCWLWTIDIGTGGYGHVTINSKRISAHRFSWEFHNGPIPEGLWVLHKCDVRNCVNPDHLWLGTRMDNIQDAVKKGRNRGCRGEKNWRAKLTKFKVLKIRALNKPYKHGFGRICLARKFGVAPSTIWAILKRKNWDHI